MRMRFRPPAARVLAPRPTAVSAEVERDRNANRLALECPLLAGRWITVDDGLGETTEIAFTATTARELVHGLGREPVGYLAIPLTAVEARTYPTAQDTRTLTLYPVTSCTCRVWVF